jgi:hypothetical protein
MLSISHDIQQVIQNIAFIMLLRRVDMMSTTLFLLALRGCEVLNDLRSNIDPYTMKCERIEGQYPMCKSGSSRAFRNLYDPAILVEPARRSPL